MKLVPGARIVVQGPTTSLNPETGDVVARECRSWGGKKRLFVPFGTEALVIGVEVRNPREPTFSTWVTGMTDRTFFRIESTRVRVVWSPVNSDSNEG